MARRAARRSLTGPLPFWEGLKPPPIGHRWVWKTQIGVNEFDLVDGGRVCLPSLYAESIPQRRDLSYWEWKRSIDAMIDEASDKQKPGKWVCPADPFWKGIEHVAQYCTDFWWEKTNKPRTPCKLAITSFGDSCQVTMNDEEKRRSTHTTAQGVREALELLNEHLGAGTAPWRYWKK